MAPIEITSGDISFQTGPNHLEIKNIHFRVNGNPDSSLFIDLKNKDKGGIADLLIRERNGQPAKKIHIELDSCQENNNHNFHGQPIIFRGT